MSESPSFVALMSQLKAGSDEAASAVFHRYARRLIGLARSHLDPLLARKVDPEDVLQSVFKSFFVGCQDEKWDLRGWDGLWSLLALMTVRKCCRKAEHFRAEMRDVRREYTIPECDDTLPAGVIAREPRPEEAALLIELVEHILAGLDERDRSIIALTLQGQSSTQIAEQLQCTTRTVQRVHGRVRGKLERQCGADAHEARAKGP